MNDQNWLENHFKQAVRLKENFAKNHPNQTACSKFIELENGQRYIFHKQTQRATQLGVNYALESQILRTISPLQFSPKVIYSDNQRVILSYLEGETATQYHHNLLEKLALNLAKLHQFKDLQAVRSSSRFAKLDIVERCHFLFQNLSRKQQQAIDLSILKPIQPFAESLCHHDLHLGNFIENKGQLFLIDWEYAAISDPALEVALFFDGNNLTQQQNAYFLNSYLSLMGFEQDKFTAKIQEYKPTIQVLNQLWNELAE